MNSREIFEVGFPRYHARDHAARIMRSVRGQPPAKTQLDDYGKPVDHRGMRRFATNAPGEGGGGPGSTAAILLGMAGYLELVKDARSRGEQVPSWDQGEPYQDDAGRPTGRFEALTAEQVVDRLLA